MFVSDFYNHRVLIYNTIPATNNASADVVIGQANFTNNLMTAYKNGSSVDTFTLAPVGNVSNTSQVAIAHRIGTNGTTPEFMFKGSIGLIRIYNTALSSSQVLANFNLNKSTFGL
jgi:hypothetical protein